MTLLNASISLIVVKMVIEVKMDLAKANIDIANTSERNIFRNQIDKWKVTPEEVIPKSFRLKWIEERKETRETMNKYWETR